LVQGNARDRIQLALKSKCRVGPQAGFTPAVT
jgi:hypothetical protein